MMHGLTNLKTSNPFSYFPSIMIVLQNLLNGLLILEQR